MAVDHAGTIRRLLEQLERYPAEVHPVEHATIQFNLGLAYAEQPNGDRPRSLAAAIRCYAAALSGFDALAYATERSRVLVALGAAEKDLGRPRQARDRFQEAADLINPAVNPAEYGSARNALGLAEMDLGYPEAAIAAYGEALTAFEVTSYPRQRAATLHNLGLAHAEVRTPENLELAVDACQQALRLVTVADAPYIFAASHLTLATSILALPADSRPSRLAAAIESLSASLTVFSRLTYPFQHAVVKHNLSIALDELASRDLAMTRRALMHAEDSVAIFDPRLHPAQSKEARANLARIEQRLSEEWGRETRSSHLAGLLASLSQSERLAIIRYRLTAYLSTPEPYRSTRLEDFDRAVTRLQPQELSAVTRAWMSVLMEQPDEALQAALSVRHRVNESLTGPQRTAASVAMEDAMGDLEILQRMRVRDLLTELGHERPEGV